MKTFFFRLARIIGCLGILVGSYAVDCFLGSLSSPPLALPFWERGPYAGIAFLYTIALALGLAGFFISYRPDAKD